MRILQVIDSLGYGGTERSLAELTAPLIGAGCEVHVCALSTANGLGPVVTGAGGTVHTMRGTRPVKYVELVRLVRSLRPALVHTMLFDADVIGRLAAATVRVPVVSSLVGDAYGPEHLAEARVGRVKAEGARLADATTARLVRGFHAVSSSVRDSMSRRLHIAPSKIEVIPRGRDAEALGVRCEERRASARSRLGVGAQDRVVLAVARHEPPKGLDTLLRAVAEARSVLPAMRVFVAGRTGGDTPALVRAAADLGVRDVVEWLGPRDDVPDLLCAADVFVLPSRREGFPGAVLEAMALETPVIATALPAVIEAVGDTAFRLVPVDAPTELATAMVDALSEPGAARAVAAAAAARFRERFTLGAIAPRMAAWYARMADA